MTFSRTEVRSTLLLVPVGCFFVASFFLGGVCSPPVIFAEEAPRSLNRGVSDVSDLPNLPDLSLSGLGENFSEGNTPENTSVYPPEDTTEVIDTIDYTPQSAENGPVQIDGFSAPDHDGANPEAATRPVAVSASTDDLEETILDTEPQGLAFSGASAGFIGHLAEIASERVYAGYPAAQEALKEMYDDATAGINTRGLVPQYDRWKRYAAAVLAKTNRLSTGLELNNRCRLSWYDRLYREPASSVFYVEAFSRELYDNLASGAHGILRGVKQGRAKMDIPPAGSDSHLFVSVNTPHEAIRELSLALIRATDAQRRGIAPLTPPEVRTLTTEAFTIFCAQTRVGHMVGMVDRAKYLIDLMEKMDHAAMYDGVETLIPLTDRRFLEQLKNIKPGMFESVTIGGNRCQRVVTPVGDIIIGGPENNTWDLEAIPNLACLIDLGGGDTYKEGTCNPDRPVLVILDLGPGNDKFAGTKPGIQGGAILGISLLFNEQGDNKYDARDIAQGATVGGAGILIEGDGNTTYRGFKRVQGCALEGIGLLIDRGGNDDFRAALLAQGLGNPRGFGVLLNRSGDDHYYVGGFYEDSYPEHPGYDGWGQGIGAGVRGVACGGIGAFLEGDGDDTYEFDYFGHGGGYWMGVGVARDFAGNDRRLGATKNDYAGGPRTQSRWQRFANGFGCHYSLGFCFDDAGDDSYDGTIMGLGMGWDLSAGFLVDFGGDDTYAATGGLTQGSGAEGSLGFLFDYRGSDSYLGNSQGYASSRLTYHTVSDCGGNFSFVVDLGGSDQYGAREVKNNMMSQRGVPSGFIIDRPTATELAEMGPGATESLNVMAKRPVSSGQMSATDVSMERTLNQLSDSANGRNSDTGSGGIWGGRRGARR